MQGLWTRELIYCIWENVRDLGRLYARFCGILGENPALKCHSRISLLSRNARFCRARTWQNARVLPAGFSGNILITEATSPPAEVQGQKSDLAEDEEEEDTEGVYLPEIDPDKQE
jgi:hypothetical protein